MWLIGRMPQVFLHAILAFFYIERAKSKLQKAGPYLLWERPHKMLKILVSALMRLHTNPKS